MSERVLIIGGGHAAGQCAASLRQKGWAGEIVIAGEEAYPPYQRPPLSKAFLAGELEADRLNFKPLAFYEAQNIELLLGKRAQKIDREARQVHFDDGAALDYDRLVLATGARVRKLDIPGADLWGVGYLRDIADVEALRERFQPGAHLIIVGAGYIGLEVAAVAAKRGLEVTVLEMAGRVMSRVTSPTVSAFFEDMHRTHGVDVRTGVRIEAFEGEGGAVMRARLAGGEALACDMAVVGVGVIPNTELAGGAGLPVDDGVIVDEYACTADKNIYAIGDCTRHPCPYFGASVRLESVHNALEQAKTAAAAICGVPVAYDQVPWFWSDQYDVKLQTVGLCAGRYDQEVVRGSAAEKKFSVFYLKDRVLIAVDSVNAPADHMISRKLIVGGARLDAAKLADPAFDLKRFL